MKIKCTTCGNDDATKFAPKKKGIICLCCYESEVEYVPENALELAQFEVAMHLGRGTGGNNRKWTKAYKGMSDRLAFLESLPGKTTDQIKFTEGFKAAIDLFNETAK